MARRLARSGYVVAIIETAGEEDLERCIVKRVKRWRFAPPKGGGFVQVSYPWLFRPADDPSKAGEFDYDACKR